VPATTSLALQKGDVKMARLCNKRLWEIGIMRNSIQSPIFTLCSLLVVYSFVAAEEQPQKVQIGEINFQIPKGYELQKIAGEDLIKWPVVADWDCKGNMLVVESGGVASPIEEHNKQALHRIVRLTDNDKNGTYDSRQVVVDKLPFTEGVLFYDNAIYACAPPNIWKFTDKDNDDVFETREVWFDGQTITFCANDLHGPYLGRDGWIYWCKGAFGEQTHKLTNGKTVTSKAAHIYRRHPKGDAIEPVISGGMDNPVEAATSRTGEMFFTSTFLHHPGNGVRDGIAHGVYGGVFGKSHDVLQGLARTGDLMPVMVELGPAAPSGLMAADRLQLLGNEDGDFEYLVSALFNLQKVSAHKLVPAGATYKAESTDLIVGDRIDFHPTDVLQDGDGSLVIVDTGGWYDLCCPTSKIDQKTAAGGIYRLSNAATRASGHRISKCPTDWSNVHPMWLTAFIHDGRPWVVRSALTHLRRLEEANRAVAIDLLAVQLGDLNLPCHFRLDALWALSWIDCKESLKLAADVLNDQSSELVQAACHIAGLHRNQHALGTLNRLLQHDSIAVRRAAAEALGRIGDKASVEPLLASLEVANVKKDRTYQHSVIYALIEINDAEAIADTLNGFDGSTSAQYAGLMALEQLHAIEQLDSSLLKGALLNSDPLLSQVAARILGVRPELASKFSDWLDDSLRNASTRKPLSESVLALVEAWKDTPVVAGILTSNLERMTESHKFNPEFINVLNLYERHSLPLEWDPLLANWISVLDDSDKISIASALKNVDLRNAEGIKSAILQSATSTKDQATMLRLLQALPAGSAVAKDVEQRLIGSLYSSEQGVSDAAINALLRCKISGASAEELCLHLNELPPRSLAAAVDAINRVKSDELDEKMLKTLVDIPAAKTLGIDQLRSSYRNRSETLKSLAEKTIASLSASSKDVEAALHSKLARLSDGDAAKGMQLFRSQKAACVGCHRVGYVGAEIGPELSRIGASRTRQALLEAIMFPSARLEQSYHSKKILTTDGHVYNGLIRKYIDAKKFEVQLTADQTVIVDTDDVEQMEASTVSIMPAGIAELLSDQELSDLLAFLESAK
jgi:putative membrane-bound dehydrogenase-like protein